MVPSARRTYTRPDLVREGIHEAMIFKMSNNYIEEMGVRDGRWFQVEGKACAKALKGERKPVWLEHRGWDVREKAGEEWIILRALDVVDGEKESHMIIYGSWKDDSCCIMENCLWSGQMRHGQIGDCCRYADKVLGILDQSGCPEDIKKRIKIQVIVGR